MPFMLRLHPTGYAQHERGSKPARPERRAKSKGEQRVFITQLRKEPNRGVACSLLLSQPAHGG